MSAATPPDAPHPRVVTVGESGLGAYGQVVVAGRHLIGADEPEAMGGRDTGPDPFELVMAGLGACTAMTLRMYATRKDWPLARVSVTVRHEKRPAGAGPRDLFTRVIRIEGALDDDQRARLVAIADKCPVHQTRTVGAAVATELESG